MQLLPFEVIIDSNGTLAQVLVVMHTVTCYRCGPEGNLIVHLMSGESMQTTTSYKEFVTKTIQQPSSIVRPM